MTTIKEQYNSLWEKYKAIYLKEDAKLDKEFDKLESMDIEYDEFTEDEETYFESSLRKQQEKTWNTLVDFSREAIKLFTSEEQDILFGSESSVQINGEEFSIEEFSDEFKDDFFEDIESTFKKGDK